jgi:PRTRC genetic system protein C
MPPEEIKAAYSMQYPELATAAIQGPEAIGDKLRYEFVRSVGAKG